MAIICAGDGELLDYSPTRFNQYTVRVTIIEEVSIQVLLSVGFGTGHGLLDAPLLR